VLDSHEGFIRAFSKQFGMNPNEFRQHWNEFVMNRAARCTITPKQDSEGETTMKTVSLVDRPERKAIVKRLVVMFGRY
jgi:AraC-like DNA-binding protein